LLNWEWTGLVGIPEHSETRLGWDWLELLIIPIVLGAGAFWFNTQTRKSEQELAHRERENDREIAEDRVREEALQRYLDRMQELILDKKLRRSEKDAEIRDVARTRTLAVLRSLDGDRKGQVAQFLHEANLIGNLVEESGEGQVIEAIIGLRNANLSNANLMYAILYGANLSSAKLSFANLSSANLSGANLSDAGLTAVNLAFTNLSGANLRDAELSDADLVFTNLSDAGLSDANLTLANLSGANLSSAYLRDANLRDARNCTNEQLARATSLVGATLPDGTKMTEEAWEEFKKRYRQSSQAGG
jgi:uncharacterized protein YjbI with pentapeptide repeats